MDACPATATVAASSYAAPMFSGWRMAT